MSSYIIEGGRKLKGEVSVSGSKNASLPIIASTILNGGTTKLYNIPDIRDTRITLEILKYLGCKVKKSHGKIEINYTNKNNTLIITTPKRRGHDFKLCFNQRKYAPRTSFG